MDNFLREIYILAIFYFDFKESIFEEFFCYIEIILLGSTKKLIVILYFEITV